MTSSKTFEACASCGCLVKREEPACPFCGAARTPALPTRGGRGVEAPWPRRSRSAWIALGSLACAVGTAGCSSADGAKAAATSPRYAALESDPRFTCGDRTCDRVVEYCAYANHICSDPNRPEGGSEDYDCKGLDSVDLASLPICTEGASASPSSCRIDPAEMALGGTEIDTTDELPPWQCSPVSPGAGCYGAPPPRPDRA